MSQICLWLKLTRVIIWGEFLSSKFYWRNIASICIVHPFSYLFVPGGRLALSWRRRYSIRIRKLPLGLISVCFHNLGGLGWSGFQLASSCGCRLLLPVWLGLIWPLFISFAHKKRRALVHEGTESLSLQYFARCVSEITRHQTRIVFVVTPLQIRKDVLILVPHNFI